MKKIKIEKSSFGKGIFADEEIEPDSIILEFKGKKFLKGEFPEIKKPEDDRYMQIGENIYFGPSGDKDDLVNHSCNPNSGVVFDNGRVFEIYKEDKSR